MRPALAHPLGGAAQHSLDQPDPVRFLERRTQRQQLVQGGAQAVDVAAGVGPAVEPLGGHVAEGADDVAGARRAVGALGLGQAEVGHPGDALGVHQDVRRLDVAVEDALAMGVGQRLGHLDAQAGDAPVIVGLGRRRRQLGVRGAVDAAGAGAGPPGETRAGPIGLRGASSAAIGRGGRRRFLPRAMVRPVWR